jgi:hypothetical protein
VRTTSSREVYRNPWIRVREDTVERVDGSSGVYGVVERPHFGLVIPAERDGYWLVEQFRYPLGRRALEFPQGTWSHGADGWPAPSWRRRPGCAPAGCATSATSTWRRGSPPRSSTSGWPPTSPPARSPARSPRRT